MAAGRVYLVGAGPGHPGLITVRGREVLARAEVLVHDSPCPEALLDAAASASERIPVGRWPDGPRMDQAAINAVLIDRARAGHTVVRLKNGDPLLFGRGDDEAQALAQAGLDFEIVPGIPAAMAAAAWAGIPLSPRGVCSEVSLAILQAGAGPEEWGVDLDALAQGRGARILYMDPRALTAVRAELLRRGAREDLPIAVVESATLPEQRVRSGTLGAIDAEGLRPPAVVFLGASVAQREPLAWAERRPLHGASIVITRARVQAAAMAAQLEELGAEVLELPCIETVAPESWEPLDRAIEALASFDWVVFSSANGVERFLERLGERGRDARALGTTRIAAVGTATADALKRALLRPDLVPEEFNADALARALLPDASTGARFLVVRALEGRDVLPDELRKRGGAVELVAAYRTVHPRSDPTRVRMRAAQGRLGAVTFASPSAVRGFLEQFAPGEGIELLAHTTVAVIGPVTARAVEQLGIKVAVCPAEATAGALVAALSDYLGSRRNA